MRAMFEPRAGRSTVLATLVLAAACALFSAQAQAASLGVSGYLGTLGPAGTAEAQLKNPRGVAVNETTGDVYVADLSNQRIQQFDALGNFVRTWGKNVGGAGVGVCTFMCQAGSAGTLGGEFSSPAGIAVDQSDGSVYVSETGNIRLQKFDASGNFLWAVGRDVAQPAGGTTTEVCAVAANCKAGTAGGGGGEFASGFVGYPTVDPASHDVYVADLGNRRVQELDSSGTFVRAFGWDVELPGGDDAFEVCTVAASCKAAAAAGTAIGRFGTSGPSRIAIDDDGVVYALDALNKRVQKFTPSAGPTPLTPSDFAPSVLSAASNLSDLAFDPVTGDLLVVKSDPGSTERRVLELDTSGNVVDTYLSGAGVTSMLGIAGRAPGGRIYVSSADSRGHVVLILGTPLAPPTATIAPVTGAAGGSATLNATVNPGGSQFSTGAHFEYSDDGTSWTKAPATDVDLGNGSTDVPVSQAVSGLDPNTTYHVRVVATRPFGAGSATSGETTFTTAPIPPVLSAVDSFQLTDATAGLRGRVNPKKAATSYHFEYGIDTGYGHSTPTRGAGAGASPTAISEKLADLRPGTTYHFRLVASNAAGATESPDRTFTTLAAPRAAGRAYELVSPADKNGGDVLYGFHAADDGDAVAYASNAARDDAFGVTAASFAVARRGSRGWVSASADAAVRESPADDSGAGQFNHLLDVSADFARVVQQSQAALTPEDQDLGDPDYYLIDLGTSNAATLASSGPGPLDARELGSTPHYVGASTDLRHVFFSLAGGPHNGVYESFGGVVRLASILPDGSAAPGAVAAGTVGGIGGIGTARAHGGDHVVSDDGSRVFFLGGTLPSSTDRPLYLRQGNTTIPISASRKAGEEGTLAGGRFVGASRDGSVVYFVSDAQLTDAATPGGGMYRYDADSAGVLEQITPSTGGLPASFVIQDAKVSDDSSHVYFTSLMAFSPEAVLGENNLYVWDKETGTTTFITALSGAIEQISRSGRFALLSSDDAIDGDPTNGHKALYLYGAAKGALHCVSCRPDGSDSEGDITTTPLVFAAPDPDSYAVARSITDDGRVFFTTNDRLLPGDRNTRYDVYEYNDGYLSLISSGHGSHDSFLADNSDDGRDVFFTTRDRLVSQDVDGGSVDLYDARIGGGIAAAETPSPRCRGDECQGDEPSAVPAATPGSATFFQDEVSSAPGAAPHGAVSFRVGKVSAAAARAMARTGKLKLSVKVGAGGKVKATVSASVKGRRTRVATTTRATTRAGTVRLVIRLSKQARAELRRKGRLRLRIVVAFSAAKRSSAATVTLTAPRSSKTAKAR